MSRQTQRFRLNFTGDVMLGRLIDQLMPQHVHEPSEAAIVDRMKKRNSDLKHYGQETPWGNTMNLFKDSDLNLINLETAVTTYPNKWPNKTFNYRMHPENLESLKAAKIDYASLANNHTLDFGKQGLLETVRAVDAANIRYAGAGESVEMAWKPATLVLPRLSPSQSAQSHTVQVFAASDHPEEWRDVKEFRHLDYSQKKRQQLKEGILQESSESDLKIFSVHWGPNYSWNPANEIRSLGHFLIDECGIDIVHGHSSHHVQGVEVYKERLIIYGCGDFIDDYALVPPYRNDLGAVWRVTVEEYQQTLSESAAAMKPLRVKTLEVFPTRIEDFQVNILQPSEADHGFVCDKVAALSADMGTRANSERGENGQLVFDVR